MERMVFGEKYLYPLSAHNAARELRARFPGRRFFYRFDVVLRLWVIYEGEMDMEGYGTGIDCDGRRMG